jgi:hypothetical protein
MPRSSCSRRRGHDDRRGYGPHRLTPETGQEGTHLVIIRASDPQGGVAFQTYVLVVRPPNRAPTINSSPVTATDAGTNYRYQVLAFDPDGDALTFELLTAPDGMTIDPRTGNVTWQTDAGDIGDHAIQVRVTDERGLSATQDFTLTVSADTEAPVVVILQSSHFTNAGTEVTFRVLATDNVAVVGRTLSIDGVPLTLDSDGAVTVTVATPGLKRLAATATDPAATWRSGGESASSTQRQRQAGGADHQPALGRRHDLPHARDRHRDGRQSGVLSSRLRPRRRTSSSSSPTGQSSGQRHARHARPDALVEQQYTIRLTAGDVNGRISITQLDIAVGPGQISGFQTGIPTSRSASGRMTLDIRRRTTRSRRARRRPRLRLADLRAGPTSARRAAQPHGPLLGMFVAFPFMTGDKVSHNTGLSAHRYTFSPVPTTGIFSLLNSTFARSTSRGVPDQGVEDQLYGSGQVVIGPAGRLDVERLPAAAAAGRVVRAGVPERAVQPAQLRLCRTARSGTTASSTACYRDGPRHQADGEQQRYQQLDRTGARFEATDQADRLIDPANNAISCTYNNRGGWALHGPTVAAGALRVRRRTGPLHQ